MYVHTGNWGAGLSGSETAGRILRHPLYGTASLIEKVCPGKGEYSVTTSLQNEVKRDGLYLSSDGL
eukprot:2932871-Rhodomonas_salina.3